MLNGKAHSMNGIENRRWCLRFTTVYALMTAFGLTAVFADNEAVERRGNLSAAERLFLEQVQPLLKKRCLGCHGEGEQLESKLDLRSRAAIVKGGDIGPALVPAS